MRVDQILKSVIHLPLICFLIGFYFNFVNAQPYVDLINNRNSFFPETPYKSIPDANLRSSQITTEFLIPFQFKNGDAFIFGASSDIIRLNYEDPATETQESLYSVSVRIGYDLFFKKNGKWDCLALLLPKLNSDFVDISSNDFQMGGLIISTFKKSEKLKYKFGWYFNSEFFYPYTFPIVGIDWQVSEKLRLFGNLPIDFTSEYKLRERFYTGFKFNPLTYSFRLSEKSNNSYIKQVDYQFKLFLSYYLTPNVVCYIEGGHTIGRYYKQFSEDHVLETHNPVFTDFNNSFLFNFGIALRAWTEKDKKPMAKSKK